MFTASFFIRCLHNCQKNMKNHYDVLGVSRRATQTEIKTAYYKLSLQHHPDRIDGSSDKFHAITAAYEVLGNYNSRRLYDKGMQGLGSPESGKTTYRPGMTRSKPPAPTGKTPIYDFDEWSKRHYGQAFERKSRAKAEYDEKMRQQTYASYEKKNQTMLVLTLLGFIYVVLQITYNESLDTPPEKK